MFSNPAAVYSEFRPCVLGLDTRCGGGAGGLRGFSTWNVDAQVVKDIGLYKERVGAQFFFTFTNITNHYQPSSASLSLTTPAAFGQVTGQAKQPALHRVRCPYSLLDPVSVVHKGAGLTTGPFSLLSTCFATLQNLRRTSKVSPPVSRPRTDLYIGLFLFAVVLAVYGQVVHFDFVTYDDPDYVTANPHVQAGLTFAGVAWAFTTGFAGNWFPLTWLSHMLDCQLFGLDSGWHHFTNVLLHALSAVILFAALKRMTGARWKSALVAFLFAIHPLRAESVAWVAERKDVLSGLFWMLTLLELRRLCGSRRTRALPPHPGAVLPRPDVEAHAGHAARGAPAARSLASGARPEAARKNPILPRRAAVSVVTFLVHQKAAVVSLDLLPLDARIENAILSYALYLRDMIWPVDLAVFYPFRRTLLVPAVIAGVILLVLTVLAVRVFPETALPHGRLALVWIALLPVIGLIQVGAQSRADRYTYLPAIGIAIAAVWGAADLLERWPRPRLAVAGTIARGMHRTDGDPGQLLAEQHDALPARHRSRPR